jgi:hypothetical protein
MGGWLQFGKGELGWGRRRRNRGKESRQSGYILTFTDGITDGHVPSDSMSSVIITDENGLSVYTDKIRDGIKSVGKNYRQTNSVSNFVSFHRFSSSEFPLKNVLNFEFVLF